MVDYVFGYGSLISKESRVRTGAATDAVAVRITGFERRWGTRIPEDRCTSLGIVEQEGALCNGVLVEIEDVAALDKREEHYRRIELPADHIEVVEESYLRERIGFM